jgi:aminodeoxyfutalosine deaminase
MAKDGECIDPSLRTPASATAGPACSAEPAGGTPSLPGPTLARSGLGWGTRTSSDASSSPFIRELPKAELHLHLEGAIEPSTLIELAGNHGQPMSVEEAAELYQYSDFAGFLRAFKGVVEHLRTPEDYEIVTYRLMEHLAAQNVFHAEVTVSVGAFIYFGRDVDAIFAGLECGRERGERDFGVSLTWIFDAVRHLGPEAAQCVAEHAARLRDRNVIAFGIGGDERRAAPELFQGVYRYAKRKGLRLTAHAGETVGPESVWGAIRVLKAERIGHGLSSWKDRELLAYLVQEQIPVEISMTSNVRTGCIASIGQHPVKTYYDVGMMITLNTDDPAIFRTSVGQEYQLAQDVFGFSDEQLRRLAMNSFEASFLPESKKQEYLKLFAGQQV